MPRRRADRSSRPCRAGRGTQETTLGPGTDSFSGFSGPARPASARAWNCRCRRTRWSGDQSRRYDGRGRRARELQRAHPRLVRGRLRRADPRPARRVGGDLRTAQRAGRRPHRLRQDPLRVPVVARPARRRAGPRGAAAPLPGPLRLPAQGARGRRRAQPPRAADRHPAHRRAARGPRPRPHRRGAVGRHPGGRAPAAGDLAAGHPDHHPRVAVPDAHLAGPGGAARGRDGDPRRGARRGRHQARRPPRAQPRAARRAPRPARPADRPLRDRAPRRGGGPLPRRLPAGRGGGPRVHQGVGPPGGRPGRGHDRAGPGRAGRLGGPRGVRGRLRRAQSLDLAARRGARGRPDRAAPVHHRLRELPPPRRAPHRPVQRDRRRARRSRSRARRPGPGRVAAVADSSPPSRGRPPS